MQSSAAQNGDLVKERDDLRKRCEDLQAQNTEISSRGSALLAAPYGLVPFTGIRARFALQPRRRRQSRKRRFAVKQLNMPARCSCSVKMWGPSLCAHASQALPICCCR